MKESSIKTTVRESHVDSRNHANWISQLSIIEGILFDFMSQLGIGSDVSKERDKGCFMITRIKEAYYPRQLFLGDVIDVNLLVWISGPKNVEFFITFRRDSKITTEVHLAVTFVSTESGTSAIIPNWIMGVIGEGKPDPLRLQPCST